MDAVPTVGLCQSRGTLRLGNCQPQKGLRAGLPDLGPGERHCFYYPGKETNLPSALEGRPISLFPKRLLNQTP